MDLHIMSVFVENKSGVLSRVVGLVSRRGFNITSLAVGPTEDPSFSRITAVVESDDEGFVQIMKQLHKLVCVYKIVDLTNERAIERELVLIKVKAEPDRRGEIIEIANIFRANIVDVGKDALIIQAAGSEDKLQGLEDLLHGYGIKEIVRTGKIAIARS